MTAREHPSSDISGVDALADGSGGGMPAITLPDESQRPKALIVDDISDACIELQQQGYNCDRLTHAELLNDVDIDNGVRG